MNVSTVTLKVRDGRTFAYTPYNPEYVTAVRQAGARWDSTEQAWSVDSRGQEVLRRIVLEHFGTDGSEAATLVSIRYRFPETVQLPCGPIVRFGRPVVSATGRDSGARVGAGVLLESGRIGSGGSLANWLTIAHEGATLIIHDVPRHLADADPNAQLIESIIPRADLVAERERLTRRIVEIDLQIAEMTGRGGV